MSEPVKGARAYDSTRRREQAETTRQTILDAAHDLFLDRGYSATTMTALAEAAGVSVQTVYKVFANKPRLAKAVFDYAIAGDLEPTPMIDRELLTRVRSEPDPRRKLELYGRFLATVAPRHVPIQLLIRDAAATDPDAAAVWRQLQDERLRGMAGFANTLHHTGALRRGVTPARARDILWTYNSAEVFQLLVSERGWTPRQYGTWVAHQLIAALL